MIWHQWKKRGLGPSVQIPVSLFIGCKVLVWFYNLREPEFSFVK